MRTHAHTLLQLCASSWAWSLGVWAAPLENLVLEHRGGTDDLSHGGGVILADDAPLGDVMIPEGGSFFSTGQDGSYRFGLQSEDQWRMESRDAYGLVEGRYVYQSPDGQTVDISYNAGPQGFVAEGDAIPGGRAPLIDETMTNDEIPVLEVIKPLVKQAESVPYGALHVSNLPDFQPIAPIDNPLQVIEVESVPAGVPYGALGASYGALDFSNIRDFQPAAPVDNPPQITEVESVPSGRPYGALHFRDLPDFQPVLNEGNTLDLDAKAIITEPFWSPVLTFEPIPDILRSDDKTYGPAKLNDEYLKSPVIEA